MAYILKEVTIKANNTPKGIRCIEELWQDVNTGKIPIIFDSENNFQQGISPISKYSNYESDENGNYDLSIIGVDSSFFEKLETEVKNGKYKKYESTDNNMILSSKNAWETVWKEQKEGTLNRAFKTDYESTVPAKYCKDGKSHCYLYISVK